jgi:phosphoribosyl 1,2-cyclic phosphate phosphodiesterase
MHGQLTFLGTGTSMGVPTLGCDCAVCTSPDPRDRRLRPSILLRWPGPEAPTIPSRSSEEKIKSAHGADFGIKSNKLTPRDRVVVIDTGPDFREQALRAKLTRVDAVFYTHAHADHILGLDDLRPLSFTFFRDGGPIPLYAAPETAATLLRVFDYTLAPNATYSNRARVHLEPLASVTPVHEVDFQLVPIHHGEQQIAGFRFGKTAYLTDVSAIPESSFALLDGLDHLILSALRHKPHPNHATVEQAMGWAKRIGARQTWLTHIAHELGHEVTNSTLPDNIRMAYDGLFLDVNLARTVSSRSGISDTAPLVQSFVSGHDFSHAEITPKETKGFSP